MFPDDDHAMIAADRDHERNPSSHSQIKPAMKFYIKFEELFAVSMEQNIGGEDFHYVQSYETMSTDLYSHKFSIILMMGF